MYIRCSGSRKRAEVHLLLAGDTTSEDGLEMQAYLALVERRATRVFPFDIRFLSVCLARMEG